MALATENADNVVHAAAGVYDSFADGTDARSRVTVKAGVGLVADDWPLQETVIKGASDTTSESRDKHGNGPKAVRCVTVNKNGYVRGFKLMDGRTSLTNDYRPDFATLLGSRAVISDMGPNVTTNAARNVVVPDEESITVSMAPRSSSRETRYELTYTPEGGSQTVISEKSAEAFSYTLDGACTVQSLDGYVGSLLLFR